ncbi:MAG: ubiquinol-cytochrome c reductase iron-sulfur subunit [Chlorobi bacterium]|nr:ubiquinol-cytochrome c reductase iron-sulfur subunit [Chlorobiota bacterium]
MEDENTTKEDNSISRRSFFKITSVALAAAMSFVLGIPLVGSFVSRAKTIKNKTFSKLGLISSIPVTTKQDERPVKLNFIKTKQDAFIKSQVQENAWVVKKTEADITVFSPICPHLGCRYAWHPEKNLFICPCHNSIFTIDGKVVSGPAPRPLDTLPVEKKEGSLYVLYERFKVGVPQKIVIGD